MRADTLVLLPRPRHLELGADGQTAGDGVDYVEVPAGTLGPEEFEIDATASGVVVRHGGPAARRYADRLLEQLRAQCDGSVPRCFVVDGPAFPVRGYMLDVSRDRVPTRETLERLVEILVLARYNHLELYVEHAFAFEGHEMVSEHADPLTPADLEWLDTLCHEVGIELVANQNTFGHMERWLKHADYRDRAECPGGGEVVPGLTLPAMLLAPTADNAEFALGLVRQQLAHLSSRSVHIGCDETFELGRGASAKEVEERGRGPVYVDHLRRLAEPLLADGYHVLFWADVIGRHPELLAELPDGELTALVWNYESRVDQSAPGELPDAVAHLAPIMAEMGLDVTAFGDFTALVRPFVEAGFPFWVCPGTSTWSSLVGRIDNATANLLDAATVGVRDGAQGILVTDWGDNGHLQPPSVSYGPIMYGGAVAWDPAANGELDLPTVLDRYVFQDSSGVLGEALDRLGRLWGFTGQQANGSSPLQAALFPHQIIFVSGKPDPQAIEGVIETIEAVLRRLPEATPAGPDGTFVVDELTVAARLARHGAWRLLAAAGGDNRPSEALAADLDELIRAHERTWLARSRRGGLVDSRGHLETTRALYSEQPSDAVPAT